MNPYNLLLARAGLALKADRRPFWAAHDYTIRRSIRRGRPEAGLWFRTAGCWHDLAGGCTMCNYGVGPPTTPEYMVDCVRRGLAELPTVLADLLVSPPGSFLDRREVPEAARAGILDLMSETAHESFSTETRAETINKDAIKQCCDALARPLKVYIGVESCDSFLGKYCVNKELTVGESARALAVLAEEYAARSSANVVVGIPFLSTGEAIDDAVRSVEWALGAGADECCLFPLHVKRWTSLQWLQQAGMYRAPSLWSYVEVLRRLGRDVAETRIELAWYTTYGIGGILESPTTCPTCLDRVVPLVHAFAECHDFAIIEELHAMDCECKHVWLAQLKEDPDTSLPERLASGYTRIGRELLGDHWWNRHADAILEELRLDWHDRCREDGTALVSAP